MHETKKVIASQSIVGEESARNNSIQSTVIQSNKYLQVLPVILSIDSYSVRTNALLDRRVNSTFFREDIAKILQLKRRSRQRYRMQFQVHVIQDQRSQVLQFHQTSPVENNHQNMVIANLLIPHTNYSTQKLQSTNTFKEKIYRQLVRQISLC